MTRKTGEEIDETCLRIWPRRYGWMFLGVVTALLLAVSCLYWLHWLPVLNDFFHLLGLRVVFYIIVHFIISIPWPLILIYISSRLHIWIYNSTAFTWQNRTTHWSIIYSMLDTSKTGETTPMASCLWFVSGTYLVIWWRVPKSLFLHFIIMP